MSNRERAQFTSKTEQFLNNSIQYLEERYDFADNSIFKKLSILTLNKSKNDDLFSWEDLSELPEILNISQDINRDGLYVDYYKKQNMGSYF